MQVVFPAEGTAHRRKKPRQAVRVRKVRYTSVGVEGEAGKRGVLPWSAWQLELPYKLLVQFGLRAGGCVRKRTARRRCYSKRWRWSAGARWRGRDRGAGWPGARARALAVLLQTGALYDGAEGRLDACFAGGALSCRAACRPRGGTWRSARCNFGRSCIGAVIALIALCTALVLLDGWLKSMGLVPLDQRLRVHAWQWEAGGGWLNG